MGAAGQQHYPQNPRDRVRLLERELELTNREVVALTLELDRQLEKLRDAEAQYRRLAEQAPDVILRYDLLPKPACSFANPRIESLTGYAPENYYANAELYFDIVVTEDRPLQKRLFSGAEPDSGTVTLRWQRRDGAVIWVEQHYAYVRDEDGYLAAVECVARDVTERRRLEEQIRQAQRAEAVGRLAAGVAHDFNNLLTVINGYSSEALRRVPEAERLHGELTQILRAGERAAQLTRQLLAFSRTQVLSPRVLDLNVVVGEIEKMLSRVLGEDIELVTMLTPGLVSVFADPGQIEQVIVNLAVNARDAMPNGGRLLIRSANMKFDENHRPALRGLPAGEYAKLEIVDTGSGISAEILEHIFDPFFTTKPVGQGTGLGLATAQGIIRQSGGDIEVSTTVGEGSAFTVYLPRAERAAEPKPEPVEVKRARGSETILVVEDDAAVRTLIVNILTQAGYSVLQAANGQEAIHLFEDRARQIDLILSDLVMPKMGGKELTRRARVLRPDIKVLFMSGYSAPQVVGDPEREVGAAFLQKPFTAGVLTAKVREMFEGPEGVRP